MTINHIIKRIQTITLAHRQVRTFATRSTANADSDHTTRYPVANLFDNAGAVNISGNSLELTYKLQLLDLVHVSQGTKNNEQDVISDMVSVALDIIAELKNPNYSDWRIDAAGAINFVVDTNGDMAAGCEVDFTVSTMYMQNRCQVPTDTIDFETTDNVEKMVYDKTYIATGNEGSTITLPELLGKKILFITREFGPIYKVSNDPDSSQYTWDDTDIVTGSEIGTGERFLILYRNY